MLANKSSSQSIVSDDCEIGIKRTPDKFSRESSMKCYLTGYRSATALIGITCNNWNSQEIELEQIYKLYFHLFPRYFVLPVPFFFRNEEKKIEHLSLYFSLSTLLKEQLLRTFSVITVGQLQIIQFKNFIE